MAEIGNKITDYPISSTISNTDKVFSNVGGALKQVTKETLLAEINSGLTNLAFGEQSGSRNLCYGINQSYYLTSSTDTYGIADGNSGLVIDVSQYSNVTVSSKVTQARYRIAFADTVGKTSDSCFVGKNQDGTSNSITLATNGHKYLIVNATDLTAIQVEEGDTVTPYEPFIPSVKTLADEVENVNESLSNSKKISFVLGDLAWNDGRELDSTTWKRSGFCKVSPNSTYRIKRVQTQVFNVLGYKENKTVITDGNVDGKPSGLVFGSTDSEIIVKTSTTTEYIRIAITDTNLNENITITNESIGNTVVELVEDVDEIKADLGGFKSTYFDIIGNSKNIKAEKFAVIFVCREPTSTSGIYLVTISNNNVIAMNNAEGVTVSVSNGVITVEETSAYYRQVFAMYI